MKTGILAAMVALTLGLGSAQAIEFGPDGFPIHGGAPKGKGKPDKATVPENAGMDGATINFGPDDTVEVARPADFAPPPAAARVENASRNTSSSTAG